MPKSGRNAVNWNTYWMLDRSANRPKMAEPMPPKPKDSPKNAPEIMPTLPGRSSVP